MLHPVIEISAARAAVLDAQGSKLTLDDAIAQLAAWIDLVRQTLTEDDLAVLSEVGAVLYKEGLAKRSQ